MNYKRITMLLIILTLLMATTNIAFASDDVDIIIDDVDIIIDDDSNIILDETTLASNAELQVISKWCKLNNVVLYLMGDENQNGNDRPGNNIARETTIAIRTPKMQLSLRDANIWKYYNQQTLMNLEDSLRDTVTQEETSLVREEIDIEQLFLTNK